MPSSIRWQARSPNMKVVTVVMVIGVLLHAVSMVTDYWVVWKDGRAGLFTYLFRKAKAPEGAAPLIYPGMSVISFLVLLFDTLLNITFLHSKYMLVMPAIFVFAFVAGLMYAVIIVLWAIPHMANKYTFSWSFGVAVAVVLLDLVVAALTLLEFLVRWTQALAMFADSERETERILRRVLEDGDGEGEEEGEGERTEVVVAAAAAAISADGDINEAGHNDNNKQESPTETETIL